MPQTFKTPGVYIAEQNAFPNSVVPVATAIPAFIGYTQQTASDASQGQDLTMIPTEITSLKQFEDYFGTADFGQGTFGTQDFLTFTGTTPAPSPAVAPTPASLPPYPVVTFASGATWQLAPTANVSGHLGMFYLYSALQMFYQNGGGTCYIISLGLYEQAVADASASPLYQPYRTALDALELEPDPTMVLCPDALMLDVATYYTVMQMLLAHCNQMQNRVALMDVYNGATYPAGKDPSDDATSPIGIFRSSIGQNYLNYGIAYFPWVNANLVASTSINFLYFNADTLTSLGTALNPAPAKPDGRPQLQVSQWPYTSPPTLVEVFKEAGNLLQYFNGATPLPTGIQDVVGNPLSAAQVQIQLMAAITAVNNAMLTAFPDYVLLMNAVATYLNIVPVAPAMAGVITAVDTNTGVWKAPANVTLNAVVSPTIGLNDRLQGDMNVDAATGKSVNAIRSFRGLGTLVWGARTLAGNSQDWRYVNVRRTMIMIEQSIKLAARSYVFEPNTASTWTTVKSMVSSFLFNLWKQGALAGAAPADAYSVQIGLGVTMTADDVLNGLMNLTVLVAVVHPAEFIVLTFQQQQQKS